MGDQAPTPPTSGDLTTRQPWQRMIHRLGNSLAGLSGLCVTYIMLVTTLDVLGRQFFSQSVPGSLEMNRLSLVAAVYLAFAAAELQQRHVEVTLVTSRLSRGWQLVASIVRGMVILTFLGLMIWRTALQALQSIDRAEYTTGLLQLPVWPAKVAIPIGVLAYAFAVIMRMIASPATSDDEADRLAPKGI